MRVQTEAITSGTKCNGYSTRKSCCVTARGVANQTLLLSPQTGPGTEPGVPSRQDQGHNQGIPSPCEQTNKLKRLPSCRLRMWMVIIKLTVLRWPFAKSFLAELSCSLVLGCTMLVGTLNFSPYRNTCLLYHDE